MFATQPSHAAGFFRRLIAAGGAALVLALAVLAACPELHHDLHGSNAERGDHQCVITLFANGTPVPAATVAIVPPQLFRCDDARPQLREFFIRAPRYLRQPERGPPASLVG